MDFSKTSLYSISHVKKKNSKSRKGPFLSQLRSPNSGETRGLGVLSLPVHVFVRSISTSPTSPNALQTLVHSPCPPAAMPDLSTGYLPPFPEFSLDAGTLTVDHAEDAAAAAADSAPAYASSSATVGGGGSVDLIIPAECRWRSRVRTFDVAGADTGAVTACPAARRGGGKNLSLIPSLEPARTQSSASAPTLEERVSEWAAKKAAAGVPAHHCVLPFLTGAPKAVRILGRSASR